METIKKIVSRGILVFLLSCISGCAIFSAPVTMTSEECKNWVAVDWLEKRPEDVKADMIDRCRQMVPSFDTIAKGRISNFDKIARGGYQPSNVKFAETGTNVIVIATKPSVEAASMAVTKKEETKVVTPTPKDVSVPVVVNVVQKSEQPIVPKESQKVYFDEAVVTSLPLPCRLLAGTSARLTSDPMVILKKDTVIAASIEGAGGVYVPMKEGMSNCADWRQKVANDLVVYATMEAKVVAKP